MPKNITVIIKSDAKIEITIITTNCIKIKYFLTALIIAFLVQTLHISIKSTAQLLSNSYLKYGTKNKSFQHGKVALSVRTE